MLKTPQRGWSFFGVCKKGLILGALKNHLDEMVDSFR